MTEQKKETNGLQNLRQALVEDVLQTSDDDILAQFAEDFGPPAANAARMRTLFAQAVLSANKARLAAARDGLAGSKTSTSSAAPISLSDARRRLKQVLAEHAHNPGFTLAARKEGELSDADVLDMLQALRELGLLD
jgi:gamma-glutamyl:cysteine ligase YbdK (ATP-grasp superfamily)